MYMNTYFIEFLGTMFIMLIYLLFNDALPIGLSVMIAILIGKTYSVGFFNPAITLVKTLEKQLSLKEFFFYTLVQIVGAIFALLITKKI